MATFVIRFFGRRGDDYRGIARHVPTGEEIVFSSFTELETFFTDLGSLEPPPPPIPVHPDRQPEDDD